MGVMEKQNGNCDITIQYILGCFNNSFGMRVLRVICRDQRALRTTPPPPALDFCYLQESAKTKSNNP